VVRLALQASTELIFSPIRHPQSNGSVERFHQDYDKHVWEDTYLDRIPGVQNQADYFFTLYRQRPHPRLKGQTPLAVHQQADRLPQGLSPALKKRPLYEGQVHFMRKVLDDKTISVLNVSWPVPKATPNQGVWATLQIKKSGANLLIFDQAPDVSGRKLLASHPFELSEPVLSHPRCSSRRTSSLFAATFRLASQLFAHLLGGTMS